MSPVRPRLLIGTRRSTLALAQTKLVTEMLGRAETGLELVVVPMKTAGDSVPGGAANGPDGKQAFTGEIDRELADGRIDIAVHSLKDVPTKLDRRLVVAATPARGDARDALVTSAGGGLSQLKAGARIGTSSVRRRSQLLAIRRDLEVVDVHGNVETRLKKLDTESLDGVVLAAAGLGRLGLAHRASQLFEVDEMVPAVCQGIIGIEARKDDHETLGVLARVNDPTTKAAGDCERALSEGLGGDCNVPLGGFARVQAEKMVAVGMVSDLQGERMVRATVEGFVSDPWRVGRDLAAKLREAGGERLLMELRP